MWLILFHWHLWNNEIVHIHLIVYRIRMRQSTDCMFQQALTVPSPRLWTTQGIRAVDPDCAETDVEFSVPKVIGKVGGRSTSNGLPVVPSNEFTLMSTISAVTAAGYSETN